MIPYQTALTTETVLEEQKFANRDYNASREKVQGFVTDLEALRQSIWRRLNTQQFEYPVYSFLYGVNWRDLIGNEPEYVRAEMKRMITETLMQDDRILSVESFTFVFSGIICICTFQVFSIFGEFQEEVTTNV